MVLLALPHRYLSRSAQQTKILFFSNIGAAVFGLTFVRS